MTVRALLLAYEFPPLASGGVHRALSFAEHLPQSGIELDVVTVRAEDYPAWSSAPIDPELLSRVPATVRVHRLSSGFPSWYWSLVARRAGRAAAHYGQLGDPVAHFWRRPLRQFLDRLVPERRPDVLVATAPPFGVAVLARELASRYRLPWVADFRDPWTLWCAVPYPTVAHYAYARAHEAAILRSANAAIATSHVTRDDWLKNDRRLDPRRLHTIYNGFETANRDPGQPAANGSGAAFQRHVVHTGSFYYTPEGRAASHRPAWRRQPHQWTHYRHRREDWLYRSPYFFLRGVRTFLDTYPPLSSRLTVTFAGTVPDWLPQMLSATGTDGIVTLAGPIPHRESLRVQRGADALLLTSARVEGGRDYSVAGKMAEYFGARRPILGVLTDGAMRDLVSRSGLGLIADPDDARAIADALARIVTASAPDELMQPDDAYLRGFERAATVRQLADRLSAAAAEGYRE